MAASVGAAATTGSRSVPQDTYRRDTYPDYLLLTTYHPPPTIHYPLPCAHLLPLTVLYALLRSGLRGWRASRPGSRKASPARRVQVRRIPTLSSTLTVTLALPLPFALTLTLPLTLTLTLPLTLTLTLTLTHTLTHTLTLTLNQAPRAASVAGPPPTPRSGSPSIGCSAAAARSQVVAR